ncbi:hypothetical protein [Gloeobacter violaceus]|uniref:Gll2950 protein n=1 Tax=Gloeobacter violaceus (strain ATCC 29082 / PCC 7421) TaxID=251221 RepID=Q7NCM8_GLOVI|nr:hypothetical protein [Gloeobacter violaceus]BAC90891.1 gll2950 [Gloeobacter violaceus PCC 7421]
MSNFKERLLEHTLTLLWSLWTELGVVGLQRHHERCLVDPEALLAASWWLGEEDPRLLEEMSDWCAQYAHLLALQRIRSLEKHLTIPEVTAAVEPLFGKSQKGNPHASSGRSRSQLPPLNRSSLLLLRLAAIFGVGSRSATLAALLADTGSGLGATEIAAAVGYTKRNIANTLEALHLGGMLHKIAQKNRWLFRLTQRKQLVEWLGPLPENWTGWPFVLSFFVLWANYAKESEGAPLLRRALKAARIVHGIRAQMGAAACEPPPLEGVPEQDVERIERWVLEVAEEVAKGGSVLLKRSSLAAPLVVNLATRKG